MSTVRNPIQPGKPTDEEVIGVLRAHLDGAEAEILARRIKTADEDAQHAVDWPTVKRRALKRKP